MRKFLTALLVAMLATLLLGIGAAQADTITFGDFSARCEVDSSKYTVLTRETLATQFAWLEAHGTTEDIVLADWKERGVYAQAWNKDGDVCIEFSAVQDNYGATYYDVNEVTSDERKTYRLGHSKDSSGEWRAQGYDYTSADWQNYKNIGRFLKLEYTRTVQGESYRGLARKTIRNGWHIHIDYQVHGRSVKNADKTAVENLMKTWSFLAVTDRPETAVTSIVFTQRPPQETNTGKFTVKGSGSAGLTVIGVVMRMTDSNAHVFEATTNKNGKFEMDVTLPQQGYWLMTYTIENNGTVVEEGAFEPITYEKGLLTVSLNSDLPATMVLTGNELVISGTTVKQTEVQCYVEGRYEKIITTNNSGNFSFTIDTSKEGLYNIALSFQKKGYTDRRFSCRAERTYTDEDRRQIIREEAKKPVYKTLMDKIDGYKGDYMVYTLNVERVDKTSTGYIAYAGMSKTKSGVYQDMVVVRSTEEPPFTAGSQARMYLKCIGLYEVDGAEGTRLYPYFDLQFLD